MWRYRGVKDSTRILDSTPTDEELLNLVRPLTRFSKDDQIPIDPPRPALDAKHPPAVVRKFFLFLVPDDFACYLNILLTSLIFFVQPINVPDYFPPSPEHGEEPEDDDSDEAAVAPEESLAHTERSLDDSEGDYEDEDDEEEGLGYVMQPRGQGVDEPVDLVETSSTEHVPEEAEDTVPPRSAPETSGAQAQQPAAGGLFFQEVSSGT